MWNVVSWYILCLMFCLFLQKIFGCTVCSPVNLNKKHQIWFFFFNLSCSRITITLIVTFNLVYFCYNYLYRGFHIITTCNIKDFKGEFLILYHSDGPAHNVKYSHFIFFNLFMKKIHMNVFFFFLVLWELTIHTFV